jgi:lipoprotein-releasing system ATP-binding protein
MSKIVLKCTKLCKTFADGELYVEVLNKINLEVKAGETVAIVGASGEGKSTLLHLLGGLDKPTSGVVNICGHSIAKVSEKKKGVLGN